MTPAIMSKAAYARHRGVRAAAVSMWIKRDQIVLTRDNMVDVAKSDARLGQMVDPAGGRPPASRAAGETPAAAPAADLHSIRARDLHERSIGQALKNAQLAGELVPLAAYEAKLQTMIAGFCDRLGAEFRGMAERLALESDKRVIRNLLEESLFTVRSDTAQRLGSAEAED